MSYPTFKIITTEEHFVLKEISQKVLAFNTSKNTFNSSSNQVQKELMSIALPNTDLIEDVAAERIKFMDDSGVDMQILSYGPGSPQNITDKILALDLCKQANNELARLIKTYPDRFSGLAVLPMADPIAASEELERSVNVLGLKGAMLSGTYNGCFFDHPQFLPVFYKAQDLNIPLYMHPAPIQENIADYYYQSDQWSAVTGAMFAGAGYGWHLDSGIGIIRLIVAGIFDKLPALKLISGHWGEMVPFYLNRLDDQLGKTLKLDRKISDYYKSNIFITPSGLFSEAQLQFAISQIGSNQILYSGDYPFLIDKNTRSFLENASISNEDKEKIGYKNAESLFHLQP
jgi:predicted TIM-barrel fold metal-dependent hydrolase